MKEQKERFSGGFERKRARKVLDRMMEKLGSSLVLVEGAKDERAVGPYAGIVIQAAGRPRAACRKASETGATEAVVLTDLDRSGDELALELRSELGRYGIRADLELRKTLGGLLQVKQMENFEGKYQKTVEEINR